MNHKQISTQEIAEHYVLRRLTPEEVDLFEEHLLFCPECRQELAELERVIPAIQEAARREADKQGLQPRIEPALFNENNQERLEQPAVIKSPKFLWRTSSWIQVAAVVLLGVVSLFLLRQQFSPQYDSTRFEPNVILEQFIKDTQRGEDIRVQVKNPLMDQKFEFNSTETDIHWNGQISGSGFPEEMLLIKLYSNQTDDYIRDRHLAKFVPELSPGDGVLHFDGHMIIQLDQGLYYYTVEWESNSEPLATGRYFIE